MSASTKRDAAASAVTSEAAEASEAAPRPTETRLQLAGKGLLVVFLLYTFICSLDLMSVSFKLLAGKAAGDFLGTNNTLLSNPIVGLMIGIVGTVLVQSSSTFTSIIITMVGGGIIPVSDAVPMIMGANIGTSVTNTLVALTQIADRNEFRRSFAAATVHDMFNWCAVFVLLTLEVTTNLIEYLAVELTEAMVGSSGSGGGEVKILKYITEPVTDLVVQINSTVMDEWALGLCQNCSLQMRHCPTSASPDKCVHFFNLFDLEDWLVGLLLVVFSLAMLCLALVVMVKTLNSLLKGTVAQVVRKVLNPKWKNPIVAYLYGYFNILVGAVMTFIVQSSSVFTSSMTPLVGIGLVEVDTVYPLFLGSNIGTTTTGILAALAATGDGLRDSLIAAFVHLFFNVFGILLFYPIPFMRFPLPMCKALGNTTAKYRWFAIAYLLVMFLLLPATIMLLSLNNILFLVVMVPTLALLAVVLVLNLVQRNPKTARLLPRVLRSWEFLPAPLHSLKPYDRIISGWSCCDRFRMEDEEPIVQKDDDVTGGRIGPAGDVKMDETGC